MISETGGRERTYYRGQCHWGTCDSSNGRFERLRLWDHDRERDGVITVELRFISHQYRNRMGDRFAARLGDRGTPIIMVMVAIAEQTGKRGGGGG